MNTADIKIGNLYSGGILGVKHLSCRPMPIYAN